MRVPGLLRVLHVMFNMLHFWTISTWLLGQNRGSITFRYACYIHFHKVSIPSFDHWKWYGYKKFNFCRCVRKSAQPHGKPQQQVSRKFNLNMQNYPMAKPTPTPLPLFAAYRRMQLCQPVYAIRYMRICRYKPARGVAFAVASTRVPVRICIMKWRQALCPTVTRVWSTYSHFVCECNMRKSSLTFSLQLPTLLHAKHRTDRDWNILLYFVIKYILLYSTQVFMYFN